VIVQIATLRASVVLIVHGSHSWLLSQENARGLGHHDTQAINQPREEVAIDNSLAFA
jgi:hypothetical protein